MAASNASHSVLIVDDDLDIRETLADVFVGEGFQVKTATNGLEALSALRAGELPCVILLDLMMPLMDGYAFLEARRGDPALHAVPVALITASGQLDASRLDGVTVIRKPIKLTTVLDFAAQNC